LTKQPFAGIRGATRGAMQGVRGTRAPQEHVWRWGMSPLPSDRREGATAPQLRLPLISKVTGFSLKPPLTRVFEY